MAGEIEDDLSGPEREFETALRGLKIATASTLDPVQCAFDAGRHSAMRGTLIWKTTAGLLSIGLAVALLVPARAQQSFSRDDFAVAPIEIVHPLPAGYFNVRSQVLAHGVDALPMPSGAAQSRTPNLGDL